MRSAFFTVVSLSAVLALALSGCVPAQPGPPPVEVDEVSVPASLSNTATTAELGDGMVAKSESLPWIVGGGAAEPGAAPRPTVWTSDDGTAWTAASVGEVKGAFQGVVAGSATLAALGGTVWADGRYSSTIFTSIDGDEWSDVDVPADYRDTFRLFDLAVTGDVVYGIGGSPDGEARGIRVDGDDVTVFDLPEVAEDELLGASSIAADGDTLLLVAYAGVEGESHPTVTFRSTDAGASWSDAVEIVDTLGFVSGVVALGDGFLATGATARNDAGATSAAAWFSSDGASWTSETVPGAPEDGPLFVSENADIRLGAPLAQGNVASALYANDNAAVSAVYTRDPAGVWSMVAQSGINRTNGADGVVMPSADGTYVAAIIGGLYARLGAVRDGAWTETKTLADREDLPWVQHIYPAEEDARLVLERGTYTVDPDLGWRNAIVPALMRLDGTTLSDAQWDPPRAAELTGVAYATADDGSQIVVGSFFGAETILAEGSYRAAPEDPWTPMAGFEGTGATNFNGAEHVGELWVAYGTSRESSKLSAPSHGLIWTSADGVSWARGGGDFGSGPLESSITGVCALPDGGLIGVGWIEESAGEFRIAVWKSDEGTWTRLDIGDLGSQTGYAQSCATGEDGVILGAIVGGRSTLLSSNDGSAWNEVFHAERGVTIGAPVAVTGGFVAAGSISSQDFSGPVVWLSKTGAEWSPVSIPSLRNGSTEEVGAWGDDLIVTMSGITGSPVSLIRDIETVIANEAP